MSRRWHRRPRVQVVTILALLGGGLLVSEFADARPGGGHSYSSPSRSGGGSSYSGSRSSYSGGGSHYSGGGSSYSGSSGDGGASFGCSMLGTLVLIGLATLAVAIDNAKEKSGWSSAPNDFDFTPSPAPPPPIDWAPLLALDPEFSRVCFEDFVFRLYASMHEARGDRRAMDALAPYASPEVREAFMQRAPVGARISNVVIGSMAIEQVQVGAEQVELKVVFESNLTANERGTWYLVEEWELVRSATARSKPPETVRALNCPNCGAPFESADQQRCDHCAEVVIDGRFDWSIRHVRLLRATTTPPSLGGYAPEVGTDLRTLTSPSFHADLRALRADDPAVVLDEIAERIGVIYERLNLGWASRNLALAQPWLSEGIYDYLRYWVDAYRRQGLLNCLEDMRLENVEFVKLTRDRWYDALTVRIHASGFDYTIREHGGDPVGGSQTERRRYTEYWTLIRGSGVRGAARTEATCPNCGAPLKVNMAGNCEHCSTHLTRGEFDWVLSKIEQDESYRG